MPTADAPAYPYVVTPCGRCGTRQSHLRTPEHPRRGECVPCVVGQLMLRLGLTYDQAVGRLVDLARESTLGARP